MEMLPEIMDPVVAVDPSRILEADKQHPVLPSQTHIQCYMQYAGKWLPTKGISVMAADWLLEGHSKRTGNRAERHV